MSLISEFTQCPLCMEKEAECVCGKAIADGDALDKLVARLRHSGHSQNADAITLLRDSIAELERQRDERDRRIAELEADAERYRWLKEPAHRWYVQVMSDVQDRYPKFCVIGKDLDAAIDAARAKGST